MTGIDPMIRNVFYDDGTYQVSAGLLSTPRCFYPIANTTARIRREPLWIAIAATAFATLTTLVYGDLLRPGELTVLWGVTCGLDLLGLTTAILHVDAVGHPDMVIFASLRTIRSLYQAIRNARSQQQETGFYLEAPDDFDGEDMPF